MVVERIPKDREIEPGSIQCSIGITGEHGVGSSSASRKLAELLGVSYQYAGLEIRTRATEIINPETGIPFALSIDDIPGIIEFTEKYIAIHPEVDANLEHSMSYIVNTEPCVFEGKALVPIAKAGLTPVINDSGNWELKPLSVAQRLPVFTFRLIADEEVAAKRILLRDRLKAENIDPDDLEDKQLADKISQILTEDPTLLPAQIEQSKRRMQANRKVWEKYNLT